MRRTIYLFHPSYVSLGITFGDFFALKRVKIRWQLKKIKLDQIRIQGTLTEGDESVPLTSSYSIV
jgi:hypothetical protein